MMALLRKKAKTFGKRGGRRNAELPALVVSERLAAGGWRLAAGGWRLAAGVEGAKFDGSPVVVASGNAPAPRPGDIGCSRPAHAGVAGGY